jgi:hypothetical protein
MDVARFLAEEFTETFCAVPRDWAETQVTRAAEWAKGKRGAFRDRVIYTGRSAGLLAVGLCVIKRGGSCKIVLLTRTGHRKSLTEFLRYIEGSVVGAKSTRIRKLYSHVTIGDTDALGAFYDSEFRPEGVLERPFNDRTDMVVLSKVL